MKQRIRKTLITIVALMLVFTFAIGSTETYATTKYKKGTSYWNFLKSGNVVYCTNSYKLFKVNLKTKKVKGLGKHSGIINSLVKKGNYLYYMDLTYITDKGAQCHLYRINLKTGKKTLLAKNTDGDYVIAGNKIYYNHTKITKNDFKRYKREMKLNGKSKKVSKYEARNISKYAPAGYDVINEETHDYSSDYVDYYLKTPKGKIFLESNYPPR